MTRFNALLAVIAAATLAGQAAAETPDVFRDEITSTLSREAVVADLAAFKKAGVNPWSGAYDPLKYFKSTRTRDEVTAEYLVERDGVAPAPATASVTATR